MAGNYHRGFLRHRFADSVASRALKLALMKMQFAILALSFDCNLQIFFEKIEAKKKIVIEREIYFYRFSSAS